MEPGVVATIPELKCKMAEYTNNTKSPDSQAQIPVNISGIRLNNDIKVKSTPCETAAVLVTNLCKAYDKRGPLVLNNFSMSVKKGTIYGLLGSSGCGKTTALSCIVGLKKWDTGEISVFGHEPGTKASGIPGKRLGYVPQDIALYDQLTIKENIQYYGRLYGMHEYEILERWTFLVNLLQLPSDFKKVIGLSGGQKRRTSLALALVHGPELLILDEPTVGLDPLLRESVWKHLYKIVASNKTTIIITTHYIEEARYSDKIGVMRNGRLLVEDSPTVLMTQYKTDLLEDVVLKLCWADTKAGNDSPTLNNNNATKKSNIVPNSRRRSSDKSTSSADSSGSSGSNVKFMSKWKNELEGVLVTESSGKNNSHISPLGKYNKMSEFDSSPVPISYSPNGLDNCGESRKNVILSSSNTISIQRNGRTKKWLGNIMDISQRIAAFCCVIYLSLIRYPTFFVAALVLPALEVLLTVASVGKEPRGLRIGVVNEEVPDWITRCSLDTLNTSMKSFDPVTGACDFSELSCKYLSTIQGDHFLNLIPYGVVDEAVSDVHRGNLRGYLHFGSNYSEYMLDRLATKQFAFTETIDGSSIRIKMDMSEYLGSVMIIKQLYDGLEKYVYQLVDSCELGAEQAEIPIKFRNPVYGTLEGDYDNYIIPGVLANIMFMMPFTVSAIMIINDRKTGTLGRAQVAGLGVFDLLMTYVITQGSIVIIQIVICTVCLKVGFDFQIVGSTLLYIAITFLLGMCGQAFGIWIGILCKDEIEALITALFILPTMLMFGGVIWPLDMMGSWKYFAASMPTTLITESLRSTATRGVDITHQLMWPGLVVTTGWGIFFWIAAIISFHKFVK